MDWAKGQLGSRNDGSGSGRAGSGPRAVESDGSLASADVRVAQHSAGPPLDLTRIGQVRPVFEPLPAGDSALIRSREQQRMIRPETPLSRPHWNRSAEPVRALQVHDRYLLAESADGVLVIDQHALHERILYEQIREKVLAGALESQNLLIPETVDLSAAEAALVLEHRDTLGATGREGGTLRRWNGPGA